LEIVNIVAIGIMQEPFDLDMLSNKIAGTSFPKNSRTWLKMNLLPEKYYIAFYRSGKFLITGVKNIEAIDGIILRVLNVLKKSDITAIFKTVKIVNMVLMDKLDLKKSLNEIIVSLDDIKASYEPEQFPGLIYKDKHKKINYLLFSNGKIIITGVTDVEYAKKNLEEFKNLIIG
jgi:transcription initiation factor TFIID TATA-box-binding protein